MSRNLLNAILIGLISSGISACTAISNFIPTQTPYPTSTTYPTQTPYPTNTPTPPPTSTPENKVIYEENDFSSVDSCFTTGSDSGDRWFAENGEYHIIVQSPYQYILGECEMELNNFILDVDATLIDWPDLNEYGVFYRLDSESDGFYAFLISSDGHYALQSIFPTDFFELLAWSAIREIKQGENTNHLKLIAIGDQFELYVNGVLVGLAREGTLRSGSFGFYAGTYDEGGLHVSFDNLTITEPPPDQSLLENTYHIIEETSMYWSEELSMLESMAP